VARHGPGNPVSVGLCEDRQLRAASQPVTETFSGSLAGGAAASFPFTVAGKGLVSATLTSLGPDSPLLVGFALGNWTGALCSVVISNTSASQGAVVSGEVTGAGAVCVGVYDVGNLQATLPFSITVVHP
jgi:hypothetical protein